MTTRQFTDSDASSIQLSLPAKISGIVFWGLVLVGLLGAVFLVQEREQELAVRYQVEATLLSHQVADAVQRNDIDNGSIGRLDQMLAELQARYRFQALSLSGHGLDYSFGDRHGEQDAYRRALDINTHLPGVGAIVDTLQLTLYMPSLQQAISNLRKKILLVIGALVFVFGLVLQGILQKVLSRPFINMVLSAEQFAGGDSRVRFDEQRPDEFGYLARFINRALDSILTQQRELESSQRALFQEKERAEVTLHSIMDGVITTTADGRIEYMNPVAERLSGWSSERARNVSINAVVRFIHEDSGQRLDNPMDSCLAENLAVELPGHASLSRQDGRMISIEASAAPMRNADGQVTGGVMVFQDVSHARRLTRQLSHQASHDTLTDLYNRRMFEDYLQDALVNVQEEGRHHALCYLDLDQFKVVNDTCGHMAGDELLRQLSVLLQASVRKGDILARLGGDEFGLLLENCPIARAAVVANNIRQKVKDLRFNWDNKTFEIGVSIGVVAINSETLDSSAALSAADMACYAAKDMGRNRVHVYEASDALLAERHGQMHWAAEITHAIDEHRLVLYQQPLVAVGSEADRTRHCEVLIRMKAEDGSFIPPNAFIPAAERYNLMPRVDRWVIRQTFSFLAEQGVREGDCMVAINLSGTSLADDDLFEFIRDTGREFSISFNNICFEITETAAIHNLARATHFMHLLRQEGCRFALDDFGSGLSSFAYLKNLPVDYLKIDGAFIKDLTVDPVDRGMVEAIIKVAHVMEIETIAEWVENEPTLQMLKTMGVDYVQGYHLGSPMPMEQRRRCLLCESGNVPS